MENRRLSRLLKEKFLTLIVLICCVANSSGQLATFQPVFHSISSDVELPSLETYSVKQDSKGYIWICSDQGVSRYDGYELENFNTKNGLTDNVVFDIYEDYKGRIWFLTYNSKLCYYVDGKIHNYEYNNNLSNYFKKNIISKSLYIDHNDNVYYSLHFYGLIKVDRMGRVFQLHEKDFSYRVTFRNSEGILSLKSEGNFFGNGKKDLKLTIDSTNKEIGTFGSVYRKYGFPSSKDNYQNTYCFIDNQVVDIQTGKTIFYDNGIISLKIVNGVFWIGTINGLKLGKVSKNGEFEIIHHYFKGFSISSVLIDKEGLIWISTLNQGVLCIPSLNVLYSDDKLGLKSNDINAIINQNNSIIVSTYNHLFDLYNQDLELESIKVNGKTNLQNCNGTLAVFNTIFQNTRIKNKLNRGELLTFPSAYQSVVNENFLYFVNSDDIIKYNLYTGEYQFLYHGWEDTNASSRERFFTSIAINPITHEIFVGSNKGLYTLKKDKLIKNNTAGYQLSIKQLEYNKRWGLVISTSNSGLKILKDNKLDELKTINGLLSNDISSIYVTDYKIYAGSSEGLNIVYNDGRIDVYNKNRLLNFSNICSITVRESDIYLGTDHGIVQIQENISNKKMPFYSVKINSILIDNKQVPKREIIDFTEKAIVLQVNFSVLKFDNWYGKKYQYRLNKTEEWIDISEPKISIYKPTGNFNIEIRYMDSDFQWSAPFKLAEVNVKVPFWKTWYFQTLILLMIFMGLFFVYQKNQKRKRIKLKNEIQLLSLEQRMQTARLNPHFVFNVLNSIHSFMLHKEMEKADDYLMKFSKLMREVLNNSRDGIIKIKEETSILNKYLELESLRNNNSFHFSIDIDDGIDDLHIPIMLIQPFVENAVIHGVSKSSGSMIRIAVCRISPHTIKVLIDNSGAFPVEKQNTIKYDAKNAIGITQKRLENYNQLFKTDEYLMNISEIDTSVTRVLLIIPVIFKE